MVKIDSSLSRLVLFGAATGMGAGLLMALYAMTASAAMGQGFFTPLYGIASPIIGPKEMETSMMRGIHFALGPAAVGLSIHMAWSAIYGVAFAGLWRRLASSGVPSWFAGGFYGLAVMAFMSLAILPAVGAASMPAMIGFSFVVEHALFGVVLGILATWQPEALRDPMHPARAERERGWRKGDVA